MSLKVPVDCPNTSGCGRGEAYVYAEIKTDVPDTIFYNCRWCGKEWQLVNIDPNTILFCGCTFLAKAASLEKRKDGYYLLPVHNDKALHDSTGNIVTCHRNRLVKPMNGFLSPTGLHVGDKLGDDTIVAYGYVSQVDKNGKELPEVQAVIVIIPREAQSPNVANYRTFYMDSHGHRTEVQPHANIMEAVERYTQEMGMDL